MNIVTSLTDIASTLWLTQPQESLLGSCVVSHSMCVSQTLPIGDGSAGESGEVGWAKRTLPRRLGGAMSLSVSASSAHTASGCREGSVCAWMLSAVPALLFLGEPLMEDHEDTLCDKT